MKRRFTNHYFDDDINNYNKQQIASNVRISSEKRSSRIEQNWPKPNIKYYLLRAWNFGI